MKKLIITVLIFAFVPTGVALAADPDVGCGVGTLIMEGQVGRPAKLLASFTNGILFSSVSVTFGLLNCKNVDGKVVADANQQRLRHYASQNFDRLAEDMAKGEGEHLDVVAHLQGLGSEESVAFGAFTQRNFESLFPHDRVTVGEMLVTLDRLMADDEAFSAYVGS